jgi:AraC-like DNA-binding protein
VKLSLNPELVPAYIDGFIIQSDFRLSRFSAVGLSAGRPDTRAENSRAELELNLAVKGRADLLMAEQRVVLEARQMLWIRPRQNRLVIAASDDFSAWVLVFRPRLVRRVCTTGASLPLRRSGGPDVLRRRLPQAEVGALAALYAGVPLGEGRDAFNAGLAYALVRSWLAYQHAPESAVPAELHPAVQRAAWLLRDSTDALDNRELGERVGLSSHRLSRLFKQQMGVPLAEFRNRQRVEHVLRVLGAGSQASLLDVALGAGFGSYAQFHRVFKAHVGVSPAEYLRHPRRLDMTRRPGR